MDSKQLHVAMLSSPGMGHLIPVLLLGNRLATHHNLRVTVLAITTDTSPAESEVISPFTSKNRLQVIRIPAADISGKVDTNAKVVTRLGVMMQETVPSIRSAISALNCLPDVLIADIFATAAWAVAEELGMPKYVFVTSTAWFTGLITYSTELKQQGVGQCVDQREPLHIPGCKPVQPEDLPDPTLDPDEMYYSDKVGFGIMSADGMLLNTWEDLEPESLYALRNNETLRSIIKNQPVYAIGPVYKENEPTVSKHEVIEWLDKQPGNSVIYVSFGSGGTLSVEQMMELAKGLQASEQRFVWVVRPPSGYGADGFFSAGGGSGLDVSDPPDYFPEGFLTQTQNIGLLVPMWGPQSEILNHSSVGGFLSHCGWNSTLESIMSGVPMIAWPLYAEQGQNAALLAEELKVAVRPEVPPTKKVVEREEIEKLVRTLMDCKEGKMMRENVLALRDSAMKALSVDGSSYISMCNFIENI